MESQSYSDQAPNSWQKVMALGSQAGMGERSGHAAVLFQDQHKKSQVFVFAGYTGTQVLGDVWLFDVEGQEWREIMGVPKVGGELEEELKM